MSYFEWNIIHISKFKPGTVEKNSSTIGPPAGIEPTPFAMPVQCSIPAGGPIVDEFFSTVPGLNLDMCIAFFFSHFSCVGVGKEP